MVNYFKRVLLGELRERYRQSGVMNPYIDSVYVMSDRLMWDLDWRSWSSRRRLHGFRGVHAGKKAVVLCNGPSLNDVDFNLLGGVFTFGLNKINLMFDRNDFRPSCIVSVNKLVIEQNRQFFSSTNIPLFIDSSARSAIPYRGNVVFLHSTPRTNRVATDCSISIVQGYTVTAVALQLALHMGFSEVALVGCDHSFATKGPANKAIAGGDTDPNHFDERYFSNVTWQLPDLVGSEFYYSRIAQAFADRGGRLVNATEGGKLELFERQSLKEFLKS